MRIAGTFATVLVMAAPVSSQASEWLGHLATLAQAQVACTDTSSQACLPYLAEAVAVAGVLTATTKVDFQGKVETITVFFRNGNVQQCTENWFQNALNGQRLMHGALGMDASDRAYFPWIDALLAAAQELCHI